MTTDQVLLGTAGRTSCAGVDPVSLPTRAASGRGDLATTRNCQHLLSQGRCSRTGLKTMGTALLCYAFSAYNQPAVVCPACTVMLYFWKKKNQKKKKKKRAICFQGFRVFLQHAVKSSYLQKLRHKPLLLVTQDRSNSLSSSAPRDHGLPWVTNTAALEPSSSLIYVRVSKFNRASGLTSAKGNQMLDIHLGEEKWKLIATCELGLAGS